MIVFTDEFFIWLFAQQNNLSSYPNPSDETVFGNKPTKDLHRVP